MKRIPDRPPDAEFIEDPHMAVVNAIEMVRTGIAFQGAVWKGLITPASFPDRVLIDLGHETGLPIPTGFDRGQLEKTAHNLENASILVAAIAADSALDAYFRRDNPDARRPLDSGDKRTIADLAGIDAVRALLYMIRNAFAHDPFNPRWEVKSKNRLGVLTIEQLGLKIDTTSLHGQPLHSSTWGGMIGFLEMLRMAERLTRPSGWVAQSLSASAPRQ